MMRLSTSAIGVFAVFGLILSPAAGDIIDFNGDGDGTSWSDTDNWDSDAVPTASDRAVIPNTFNVNVDGNFTVDTIEIQSGGTLSVVSGKTLTLENNNHNENTCPFPASTCNLRDHSKINDKLTIGSNSTIAIVQESHEFKGSGEVEGLDFTAEITIADTIEFRNNVDGGIFGSMKIEGDGTFINKSVVESTDYSFWIDCEFDDIAGAKWVVGCNSSIDFKVESLSLEGDFVNESTRNEGEGYFDFSADVTTCGTWRWDCASGMTLAANVEFKYADYEDLTGLGCDNPETGGGGTCADPWVIDSTIHASTCQ